jgi:hypothetical protein
LRADIGRDYIAKSDDSTLLASDFRDWRWQNAFAISNRRRPLKLSSHPIAGIYEKAISASFMK